MKIWVILPYRHWQGYGTPLAVYKERPKEEKIWESFSDFGDGFDIEEYELLDAPND